MRDTQRKFGGVALGQAEAVTVENTATFARPSSMYPLTSVDVDRESSGRLAMPAKVFDVEGAIRRFDDIPTVNRDQVPFAKPRYAKGTRPLPSPQIVRSVESVESVEPVESVQHVAVERSRPRCALPQEVEIRHVLEALRRTR